MPQDSSWLSANFRNHLSKPSHLSKLPGGTNSHPSSDKPERFTLYVTTAEHGIAMAEYIYLLADGDRGWKQTAQSWVQTYRPFLLGDKLYDCKDWHKGFIRFVDRKLDSRNSTVDRIDFCYNLWKRAQGNRS